ncbi:MAG: hypothetical protein Q7Q71_14735 [Verrucomicrobiota bacterium JB023]|nr:hypothetical protein [Verrucomicrobiota bacterium JB023]
MNLFLLDAIGPFFRGMQSALINWSKIPFDHLPLEGPEADEFWQKLESDFRHLASRARELGYNALTLDDLPHLTPHPWHGEELNHRIESLARRFDPLFAILAELDLQAWVTVDILTLSEGVRDKTGSSFAARNDFFLELVELFQQRHPSVKGLILRIGESDGLDVKDDLRSELHLRNAKQVNAFLKQLVPLAERLELDLILRTWTVGAHRIGDLIWHRGRLADALDGIDSPRFILSMKPGESDFFRHLPLNRAFFRYQGPKILELQARREYEGAGEFPSWIGPDCEQLRDELANAENMRGISVWCQTGGWHRFKRLTFLQPEALWAELNTKVAIDVFRHGLSSDQSVAKVVGPDRAASAIEMLNHTRHVILNLYYIPEYARQKLFFRRVRLPPLLHVYWDSIYLHSPVRKLLRHFVTDHEDAIQQSAGSMRRFPRIIELAEKAGWPSDDLRFMRDTCQLIHLARTYYFTSYDEQLVEEIKQAKRDYKKAWPRQVRARYRVKTFFDPSPLNRRQLLIFSRIFLRRQRGYRNFLDRVITLNLLSFLYRFFKNRSQKALPSNLRNSAMGVDSLFK